MGFRVWGLGFTAASAPAYPLGLPPRPSLTPPARAPPSPPRCGVRRGRPGPVPAAARARTTADASIRSPVPLLVAHTAAAAAAEADRRQHAAHRDVPALWRAVTVPRGLLLGAARQGSAAEA